MEIPQDVETMRSFLSLINYLNQFSPHLAELSDLLREICRKNMEFELIQLARLLSKEQRRKFQKSYPALLQSKNFYISTD